MFGKLFGFGKKDSGERETQSFAPEGSRIYCIGDINGCLDALREVHAMILQDARVLAPERLVVIYLGDYIDRGEKVSQTLDYLIDEPLEGFERIFLRGNHEEFLLSFLEDADLAQMWLPNGGDTTLLSYGVGLGSGATASERYFDIQYRLREAIPERHMEFIRKTDTFHVEGDYLFVHAGVRPGVPMQEQSPRDLMWIRDEFMTSNADHGYCVVHGHTIVPDAEFRSNRISPDTGAYMSNVLSCGVLEGSDQRVLHT